MEEAGVQDDCKRKEENEQQNEESICSEKGEKAELRDDDSFEVISISCNDSSKYSTGGDSDEEDALVSISDSMNKSFPEVELLSDLVKPTASSITLTSDNDLSDYKYILSQDDFALEGRFENISENTISSSFSQGDQTSSISLVKEPPEMHKPVLNIEHILPSQSIQEYHLVSQMQSKGNEDVTNFCSEPSNVISNPADVFEKPSSSTWAACSNVNTTDKFLNASTVMESKEGNSLHSSPQQLRSVFVERQLSDHAQLSGSVPNIQAKKAGTVNPVDRRGSPTKMVLSVGHLPKVQNSASGFWEWLCPKNFLHKLINKALASIDAVINTLDPQMKNGNRVKPDFEVLIASTCDFESCPIRKAFRKMFFEKVGISNISVTLGCVPAQPVGFRSGLYCAERRIRFMREHRLVDKSKIIVATSPVLVEVTPLRWHHTTCLMLDDPNLGLTLHTFTQTVPVPNVYVNQVQLRTPSDYHLKHLGFSITVGRVISIMTGMPENDWQHAMTGTSFNKILESAAVVLAGMYKSYLNGVSY